MLDDLHEQIKAWLTVAPGVTATEILVRIKAMHPDRFTDRQARAVKQWRVHQARRIIVESSAAIAAGISAAA